MFIGFGSNSSYWLMVISFDNNGGISLSGVGSVNVGVYPTRGEPLANGSLVTLLDDIRTGTSNYQDDLRDLSGGDSSNWDTLSTTDDDGWPLYVTVTNDVDNNATYVVVENGDRSVNVSFSGTFDPESPLSFVWTNDVNGDKNEGFEITDIEVTLKDGVFTDSACFSKSIPHSE